MQIMNGYRPNLSAGLNRSKAPMVLPRLAHCGVQRGKVKTINCGDSGS